MPATKSLKLPGFPDAHGGAGGPERVETRKMGASKLLTFLAFEVVVLCVLAWRHHYR